MAAKSVFLSLVFILCAVPARPSLITVDFMRGGIREIGAVELDGNTFGSAAGIMDVFSIGHSWSMDKRKLVMNVKGTDLVFTESNPFVMMGEAVVHVTPPPLVENGDMFIAAPVITGLLDSLMPQKLAWDPDKKSILVKSGDSVITDFRCEKKANGTLYTLFLPDSMRFDYTFFKPQLNINIFKAKIAVNRLRVKKPAGHVREIDAVQFKDNAQISLMVDGRAQKPEVAYRGNPPRIEVVLRDPAEEKPAPAAPKGKARKIRTIIIDPGHGGQDAGAVNRQLKILEKHVVLSMGLKIKKALEKRFKDVKVVITRDEDEYIALKDRIGLANKYHGDLFISVHANAIPGNLAKRSSVQGYVVYFLDVAQDEESRAVAALENSVLKFENEEKGGKVSDIDFIIKQSELNTFRNESEDFAIILEQAMDKTLKKVERRKTGVNQAWFYVLRGPEMPAVLIETAFISNPREARILKMSSFHQQVAEAVADAVGRFKKKYE